MSELIVEARNLNFAYGDGELRRQVLYDVSLDMRAGEIVLLTGPSGCGKTTLLTLVGALRSVTDGQLRVLGSDLHRCRTAELVTVRRRIGFIFQAHNLLDFLTARQNVQMAMQMHHEYPASMARQRSAAVLEQVGLAERAEAYPAQMSGGQKQRVSVARALVAQPQLVLADEPTSALDSQSGRDVVNLLKALARERGCAILMVTHDSRVLDIADRVVRMEDGRIAGA